MHLHREHHFEAEICAHLAAHGWAYDEGNAALFDRDNGLFLPDLLAWVEATQPDSYQRLAKTHGAQLPRVLAERVRGRMFQVLGSATADPGHPHRLASAAAVAEGLVDCRLRQVVLGFQVIGDGSRWLTNDEISAGVLEAVRSDRPLSVIGQVEPWSARP